MNNRKKSKMKKKQLIKNKKLKSNKIRAKICQIKNYWKKYKVLIN